jgi:DNA-binding PadR family transcriptional regulator
VPHTQIYKECERLAEGGLLTEQREESGRRRRFYKLAPHGRQALEKWRGGTTEELYEARDPALLRLFFGGDPAELAAAQIAAHRRKLEELEAIDRAEVDMPRGMRLALEMGISHQKEFMRSWSRLEKEPEG